MQRIISSVCLVLLCLTMMAQSNDPRRRNTYNYNTGRSTTNSQRQRQNPPPQRGSELSIYLKQIQERERAARTREAARRPGANENEKRTTRGQQEDESLKILTAKERLQSATPPKRAEDDIVLVVNGEGKTKEEATASALRGAIEQAFGTFVSANTTLLNDDLVRDDIATVSSGNIKSYKELSCTRTPDGLYNVSVSAVVSIGKLILYAQSHGSSAEFAGQTFVMNMRMRELNKKNEYDALQNLIVQLRSLQDDIFDYDVEIDEVEKGSTEEEWMLPVILSIKTNENYVNFMNILTSTLSSLSLSAEEQDAYKKNNMDTYCFAPISYYYDNYGVFDGKSYLYFRNENKVLSEFSSEVCKILDNAQQSCMIRLKGGDKKIKFVSTANISLCTDREDAILYLPLINRSGDRIEGWFLAGSEQRYRMSSLTEATIPLMSGKVFAQSRIIFRLTMEELSKVYGAEAVKYSLSTAEDRIRRFKTIAVEIGLPYIQIGNYEVSVENLRLDFKKEVYTGGMFGGGKDLYLLCGYSEGEDFLLIGSRSNEYADCIGRDWRKRAENIYYNARAVRPIGWGARGRAPR